jgi:hypothetical protein
VIDAGLPLIDEVSVLEGIQGAGPHGPLPFSFRPRRRLFCEDCRLLRDIGVTGVLNKPFDPLELLRRLPHLAA